MGLRRSDPIQPLPASHSTARSSQELSEKGTKTWENRGKGGALGSALWQSGQGLHGAMGQSNPPPQNPEFLRKPLQKELPQPSGEARSAFYCRRPGPAAIACRNSTGTRNGGRRRVPEGKPFFWGGGGGDRGKAPTPCQNPGSNPANLSAEGLYPRRGINNHGWLFVIVPGQRARRGRGSARGPAPPLRSPSPPLRSPPHPRRRFFFGGAPADFGGGKKEKQSSQAAGSVPPARSIRRLVFGRCVPLHQLVDEQLDPGRLGVHAHLLVILQAEPARR